MVHSAYQSNKRGDAVQPWGTPFPVWKQSAAILLVVNQVLGRKWPRIHAVEILESHSPPPKHGNLATRGGLGLAESHPGISADMLPHPPGFMRSNLHSISSRHCTGTLAMGRSVMKQVQGCQTQGGFTIGWTHGVNPSQPPRGPTSLNSTLYHPPQAPVDAVLQSFGYTCHSGVHNCPERTPASFIRPMAPRAFVVQSWWGILSFSTKIKARSPLRKSLTVRAQMQVLSPPQSDLSHPQGLVC